MFEEKLVGPGSGLSPVWSSTKSGSLTGVKLLLILKTRVESQAVK